MKISKVKVSHKKIKEFKNLYYFFNNENELIFYIDQLRKLNFIVDDIKVKGKIDEDTMDYILLVLKEGGKKNKTLSQIREGIYA